MTLTDVTFNLCGVPWGQQASVYMRNIFYATFCTTQMEIKYPLIKHKNNTTVDTEHRMYRAKKQRSEVNTFLLNNPACFFECMSCPKISWLIPVVRKNRNK